MPWSGIFADGLALVHFAFVLFVTLGALLVLRWRRLMWVHVPAVVWGIWVEMSGGLCPLTPLEQELRLRAGESGYTGGFVEHYILRLIYPEALTRSDQFILGLLVLAINVAGYGWIFRHSLVRVLRKGIPGVTHG